MNELATATVDDLLSWGPCWITEAETDEEREEAETRIRTLAAGREVWTALDVLEFDEIEPRFRLWIVLRRQMLSYPVLRLFAANVAGEALRRTGVKDERCWAAVGVAWRHARGEASHRELRDASTEAWKAVREIDRARGGRPRTAAEIAAEAAVCTVSAHADTAACDAAVRCWEAHGPTDEEQIGTLRVLIREELRRVRRAQMEPEAR